MLAATSPGDCHVPAAVRVTLTRPPPVGGVGGMVLQQTAAPPRTPQPPGDDVPRSVATPERLRRERGVSTPVETGLHAALHDSGPPGKPMSPLPPRRHKQLSDTVLEELRGLMRRVVCAV